MTFPREQPEIRIWNKQHKTSKTLKPSQGEDAQPSLPAINRITEQGGLKSLPHEGNKGDE